MNAERIAELRSPGYRLMETVDLDEMLDEIERLRAEIDALNTEVDYWWRQNYEV